MKTKLILLGIFISILFYFNKDGEDNYNKLVDNQTILKFFVFDKNNNYKIDENTLFKTFPKSNTHMSVQKMHNSLKNDEDILAQANSFPTVENKYECIIMIREETNETTIMHELGHCYNPLLQKELHKNKYKTILDKFQLDKKFQKFILESFADTVIATSTYNHMKNFNYIDNTIQETYSGKRTQKTEAYYYSSELLKKLKDFIINTEENKTLPLEKSKQIEFILEKFYFNLSYNSILK